MWRVLSETDPNGYTTSWQYDRLGRITRVTHPNGGFETYTYNDQQNTLTHHTILGATYTHTYDGLGNLLTITDPSGTVILQNTYDNRMRLTETRNAQGIASSQRTLFHYDIFDRVVDTLRVNPAGGIMYRETTIFQDISDAAGNSRITTTIHGDGPSLCIQTFVQYDRFGRRTQEGTVGGMVVTYTHDLSGRVIREQSLGVDNTFTHNIFGITSIRNIEGNTRHNTYDNMGRLVTSSDFMGNVQRFTYDALGRLVIHDVPFERVGNTIHYARTAYVYDRNGNLLRSGRRVNLPGQPDQWAEVHNTFLHNRLMSSQSGNGPLTEYTYDLAGNVLTKRVGGAGGATTSFAYNNRGQLTRTTDALGQAEIFAYDANGLLLTRTDRNGTVFRNTHDNMGRVAREEAVQNGAVTAFRAFIYTSTGSLRLSESHEHAMWMYYDPQGLLNAQAEPGGQVRQYSYNAANNLVHRIVWADWWGNPRAYLNTTYTYDTAQRLQAVYENGVREVTYVYDANGRRTYRRLRNGATTRYTYNLSGLITLVENFNRYTGVSYSTFAYVYYLDGNIRQVTETMGGTTGVVTYTYDTARRLTNEHDTRAGATSRAYTFDNRGNRTRMTVTGAENYTVTYTHDLNNRLLTETRTGSNPSVVTLTHDRNGNQLTRTTGNEIPIEPPPLPPIDTFSAGVVGGSPQTETRTYNAFNQLVRFEGNDAVSTYVYRPDGLRLSQTVNGVRTTHVWCMGSVVLEQNATGGVVNRFVRSRNGLLIRSEHHGWYLFNVRGDVVQRTDNQGNLLMNYRYTAFGNELTPVDSNTNRFRFAGEYWDAHRGEYYLRARSFNPRTGRFTQPDPFWGIHNMQGSPNAIAQSSNLFMFAMHNPIRWVDPSGLFVTLPVTLPGPPPPSFPMPGGACGTLGEQVTLYIPWSPRGSAWTNSRNNPNATWRNSPGAGQAMPAPPLGPPPSPPSQTPARLPFTVIRRGSGTTFTPYDRFLTKADVMLAFALTYHPQSENQEWGAWIHRYRANVGGVYQYHYRFSTPVTGPTYVPLVRYPGTTAVAWIHTHPHSFGSAGEQFSGRYGSGIRVVGDGNWARITRQDGFLVTPSGVIKQLCRSWSGQGTVYVICSDTSPYVTIFIESIFMR